MSQSSPAKKTGIPVNEELLPRTPSLGMVFTMDVTCPRQRKHWEEKATNNGVVASQEVRTAVSLKRKVKPTRDPSVKSAILHSTCSLQHATIHSIAREERNSSATNADQGWTLS
ncbi:hypothetical protein GQ600_12988 [Phytophthora cactorum]|nr:hypothetical protein GQ600_12988 [Phytophthora cactorum]